MDDKVVMQNGFVIKYNTHRYSQGLERITELMSLNHNREIRVFKAYKDTNVKHLLIPNLIEANARYLKLERLIELDGVKIDPNDILPALEEFSHLMPNEKIRLSDIISSPLLSLLRGLLKNARFLGAKNILKTLKRIRRLYACAPKSKNLFLIHRDLKTNQNMMATEKGIYFIDFGSSILTRHFFLADIVELATDHISNCVDFELIKDFVYKIHNKNYDIEYLRCQIFLLLMRRTMHFGPSDRNNTEIMSNLKLFINNLDAYVDEFDL